ncbi:terminase TerL endonuclease subunit [uncultured Desulfosarcina sp.]|uniref:terminase large subunit n=1 Tax=uncultured Desulfosarcina sp. TaxID=218289 RepID=UPI0029C734E7|nr:terminase TerL endonuclease subunit [uncultured Desulfosarcina sp.]
MGKRGPKSAAKKYADAQRTGPYFPDGFPWDNPKLTRATRVIKFVESLPITSGVHAGKPFRLRPWQKKIVRAIYRTRRKKRIVRTALITMPRKNGKSALAAALALCHLLGPESEQRGQCYSAAADREQAAIIFREMEAIILAVPEFEERCHIQSFYKMITDYQTGSVYRAMSADGRKAHGLSPSFMIYDELAQAKDRELYDNLTTGTGARAEPLMVVISTQSPDPHHIMSELVDYAIDLENGTLPPDPSFFGCVYAALDDADAWDEKTWKACNPALGDFRSLPEMRQFAEQAKRIPTKEATFRNLYLNQRVDAEARFISSNDYDACVREIPDLAGRACYGGLDLSSTQDLTAFVLCFPPQTEDEPFFVLPFAWVPAESIRRRAKEDRVPYDIWQRDGYIEPVPGSVIDYQPILAKIDDLAQLYDLQAIAFDRWGATRVVNDLTEAGMTVLEFGQGFASMSPPSKEMEKLILERKIGFPDNPVIKWCFGNVIAETDAAGNIKFSKKKSAEKIDVAVAAVMALDGAIRNQAQKVEPSIVWM